MIVSVNGKSIAYNAARWSLFLAGMVYLLSCAEGITTNNRAFSKAYLKTINPILLDGEMIYTIDSICFYYYKNYVVLHLSNQYQVKRKDDDSIFNKRLADISYNYFAFNTNDQYGDTYRDLSEKAINRIFIDSLLGIRSINRQIISAFITHKIIDNSVYSMMNPMHQQVIFEMGRLITGDDVAVKSFFKRLKGSISVKD